MKICHGGLESRRRKTTASAAVMFRNELKATT